MEVNGDAIDHSQAIVMEAPSCSDDGLLMTKVRFGSMGSTAINCLQEEFYGKPGVCSLYGYRCAIRIVDPAVCIKRGAQNR
eukprot:1776416-Alexandrium_andersonii.AAC.1